MMKFAITHVKGDVETILGTYISKEDAYKAASCYRKKYTNTDGIISCIEAEFDSNGKRIGNTFRLYDVWLGSDLLLDTSCIPYNP